MKLMRIGESGAETPCVVDSTDTARDVSGIMSDFGPETLGGLAKALAGVDLGTLPAVDQSGARIGAPIAQPRNIYCIGLNYSDHAAETGMPVPDEPILFNKTASTFCGPNDPVFHSSDMTKLDWEVELAVVIGKTAYKVPENAALDHVFGYTLANDVSERAWQQERGGQWTKGKSFPNFCPVGPVLVTGDDIADPEALGMWLDVNGTRRQTGNTATMVFTPKQIVSYLSEFLVLEPGDLILTGTPPGVAAGMADPAWLKPGDVITLGIDGLGTQRQTVRPYPGP